MSLQAGISQEMINPTTHANRAPYMMPPVANQSYRPHQGVFYAFDQELASLTRVPVTRQKIGYYNWFCHPIESYHLSRKLVPPGSENTEGFARRLSMYTQLKAQLSPASQKHLYQQLKAGRLMDNRAEDNKSTLTHLYNLTHQPRAAGFDAKIILEDLLRLLNTPQEGKDVNQKRGQWKPMYLKPLMAYYNGPNGPKLKEPIDPQQLFSTSSATCVASSVTNYMIRHNPSEFARQISELTSPRLAFWEKASAVEISPEDPSQAAKKLAEYEVTSAAVPGTNGAQYQIKVELPYSGVLYAMNQQGQHDPGSQSVVEAAYQVALTRLAAHPYDPGLDTRINPDGTLDPLKGLEEDRKTLMETLIKDNGGTMSVTYQFTASDSSNEPYLMGYYRNFEKTTQDLMQAIDMGEDVIIGITGTDEMGTSGRINMGHEITITGYERNKKTGEVLFTIADSDDGNPKLVKRAATEIVPKIHHVGFPVRLAQKIWKEINGGLNNQYLIPGPEDAGRYQLITTVPPSRQPKFLEEYNKMLQAPALETTPAETSQPIVAQAPAQSKPQQGPQPLAYTTPYPGAYYAPKAYAPYPSAYYPPMAYAPRAVYTPYPAGYTPVAYNYPTYNTYRPAQAQVA